MGTFQVKNRQVLPFLQWNLNFSQFEHILASMEVEALAFNESVSFSKDDPAFSGNKLRPNWYIPNEKIGQFL